MANSKRSAGGTTSQKIWTPALWGKVILALIALIGTVATAYLTSNKPSPPDDPKPSSFEIEGFIWDQETHQPIVGASLTLAVQGPPTRTTTDANGFYHSKLALEGNAQKVDVRRIITAPGYAPLEESISVSRGSQNTVYLAPLPKPKLEKVSFDVKGFLSDPDTRQPITNATLLIIFKGAPVQASTDSNGYYQFSLNPAANITELAIQRKISAPGYVPKDENVTIKPGPQTILYLSALVAPITHEDSKSPPQNPDPPQGGETNQNTKTSQARNTDSTTPNSFPPFSIDSYQFGETREIQFTKQYSRNHRQYVYEFDLDLVQGDKLRFRVSPVAGAALKSVIYVYKEGKEINPYKSNKILETTYDWTMTEGLPGSKAKVRILGSDPGKINIRIDKAR